MLVCGPVVRVGPVRLRVRRAGARSGSPRHPRRRGDDARTAPACSPRRAPPTSSRPAAPWRRCGRVLPVVAGLAARLAAGEALGAPDEEGYLPRGLRTNALAESFGCRACTRPGARSQLARRDPHRGRADRRPRVAAAAGRRSSACVTLALVTEAGCVPQGNPDRPADPARAHVAPLSDRRRRIARRPERTSRSTPGSTRPSANADPNRLVPLDAARALEAARGDRRGCTASSSPPRASTHRCHGGEVRAGDGRGVARGGRAGRDPHRHLRDRHALRGNAGEGVREDGDPDRVHHGAPDHRADGRARTACCAAWSITHPTGEPSLARAVTSSRSASGSLERARGDARDRGGAADRLGGRVRTPADPRREPDAPARCPTWSATARSRRASRNGSPELLASLRTLRGRRRLPAAPGLHRQPRAGVAPRPAAPVVAGRTAREGGGPPRRDHRAGGALRAPRRAGPVRAGAHGRGTAVPASCRSTRASEVVGAFAPDHEHDESLTASVLLENLACMASAVHATRFLLADAADRSRPRSRT